MEYKFSFKPPDVAAKDGSVPLWIPGGHVIPSADEVRLAASLPDQRGSLWTSRMYEGNNWEIEAGLRINGKVGTGSDGMTIWFISDKSDVVSTFGGPDTWNGLAVILDSFDNDNKANNPLIGAFINNGSYHYSHERDGEHQLSAGCLSDYRNKPFPVYIKISYFNNILSIDVSDGMTAKPNYHSCGRKEGVVLPSKGYFGLTASTGKNKPDDHDCYSFIVHSIVPRSRAVQEDAVQRKQIEEYLKKSQEINAAQQEYAREHPGKARNQQPQKESMSSGFDQDIKLIYDTFSEIRQENHNIMAKLNEIIGRQEAHAASISKISGSNLNKNLGQNNNQAGFSEVQRILQLQNEVVQSNKRLIKDIQDVIMHINNMPSNGQNEPWKKDISGKLSTLLNRKPPRENRSSNKLLWLVIIMQSFTLIGALIVLGRAEQTVKKFY